MSFTDQIRQALTPDHPETKITSRITAFMLVAGSTALTANQCYEGAALYGLGALYYMATHNNEIGAIAPLVRDQIERDEAIIPHDLDF